MCPTYRAARTLFPLYFPMPAFPSPPTFALIGAAGYIAPRHLAAIKAVGGHLVAAYDPFDSVGILDRYFPEAAFFTEFERFDRHLELLKRTVRAVDYVVVCSPNYLHDAHCRFGLRYGADVICEKPLVLNPWNAESLRELESESGKRVFSILQLRLHTSAKALQDSLAQRTPGAPRLQAELTYLTARGNWYYTSWKGNEEKSGGVVTNIGIHFFDLLQQLLGPVRQTIVHQRSHDRAAGFLALEHADVSWYLSIDPAGLPAATRQAGGSTFRSLQIGTSAFDFSVGFEDLHQQSYAEILAGRGFGIDTCLPAIRMVHDIRNAALSTAQPQHPMCALAQTPHPFIRD